MKCRVLIRSSGGRCCPDCTHEQLGALTLSPAHVTLIAPRAPSPLFDALSTKALEQTPSDGEPVRGPSFVRTREYLGTFPERQRAVTEGEITLRHWTTEGRDTLARILRRTIERNRGAAHG